MRMSLIWVWIARDDRIKELCTTLMDRAGEANLESRNHSRQHLAEKLLINPVNRFN